MSLTKEEIEKLKKKLLEMAEESTGGLFWIPQKEGDFLFGKVLREREVEITVRGGQKKTVKAIDIRSLDDDMIYTVTLTHQVLARLWDDYGVQPGDIVLILYKGAVRDDSGNVRYHLYGLGVEKALEEGKVPSFYLEEEKEERREEVAPPTPSKEVVEVGKEVTPAPTERITPATTLPVVIEEKPKSEIPEDLRKAVELAESILQFYDSITKGELEQMIKSAGFKVEIDDVIKHLGEKIRVEGDSISLAK